MVACSVPESTERPLNTICIAWRDQALTAVRQAELRFYAELNDFLPRNQRFATVVRSFNGEVSLKDMIEAIGVPHAEVDLLIANGEPVDFTYRVGDGDRIAVYPMFEAFDIGPIVRVRPQPLREPRFAADVHLGRLARHLRLLGFDTLCRRHWDDTELAATAHEQQRIILTRDVGLLKRSVVTHGMFVRAHAPRAQLLEVVRRLQLVSRFRPFTRCLTCNGSLVAVGKNDVATKVPERAWLNHDDFVQCAECHRIYWRGTHFERLRRFLDEVEAAARQGTPG
jgi:uncharacterized protein